MSVPVEKLLCETRRVFQAMAEVADEALGSLGVSAQEWALLEVLAREDEPVAIATLARLTLTPLRETGGAIAALCRRGWVECGDGPSDAPQAMARLNQEGRALRNEMHASDRILLERLEAALDEQAVRSTFSTLRTVRRLLRRRPVPAGFAPCPFGRTLARG